MPEAPNSLPQWFIKAQNISKPLSIGFLTAIAFLMYGPGIKSALGIRIAIWGGYINIYDLVLLVIIVLALPFIILAGQSINISNFIKKP